MELRWNYGYTARRGPEVWIAGTGVKLLLLPQQFQVLLIQYAPNVLSNDCINVGLILVDRESAGKRTCIARFCDTWIERVAAVDADADFEMLSAIFQDISNRLKNPDLRVTLLATIRDSFSNAIRVSERTCSLNNPEQEIDTFAAQYLSGD